MNNEELNKKIKRRILNNTKIPNIFRLIFDVFVAFIFFAGVAFITLFILGFPFVKSILSDNPLWFLAYLTYGVVLPLWGVIVAFFWNIFENNIESAFTDTRILYKKIKYKSTNKL